MVATAEHHSGPRSVVSKAVEKSLDDVLRYAFGEMLCLLKEGQLVTSRPVPKEVINTTGLRSIMFTVASSTFRVVVLVHLERFANLPEASWQHFSIASDGNGIDEGVFHDYVCELGNNFCGVICRLLADAGFSTGLSTPITLGVTNSTHHFRGVSPSYETHFGGYTDSHCLILASLCLFPNAGKNLDFQIPIPSSSEVSVDTGELEFF